MKGKIFRVTYNAPRQFAEIHMEDGSIVDVPMKNEEWEENLKGDVKENFRKYIHE